VLAQLFHFLKNIIMFLKVIIKFSVVTVIETGTETAVLCLGIDGSVLKWSSSGVLNVSSRLHPASRLAHSSRRRVLSLGSKVRLPAAAALHPACEDRWRLTN